MHCARVALLCAAALAQGALAQVALAHADTWAAASVTCDGASDICDPWVRGVRTDVLAIAPDGVNVAMHVSPSPAVHRSAAATARFADTYESKGWAQLWLNTPDHVAPEDAMFAAGYLEGALTAHMIWPNFVNLNSEMVDNGTIPVRVRDFAERNLRWMRREALRVGYGAAGVDCAGVGGEGECNLRARDASEMHEHRLGVRGTRSRLFWRTVYVLLRQLDGLVRGYQDHSPAHQQLSSMQILMLVLDGDFPDLMSLFGLPASRRAALRTALPSRFRCSALVKLLPDGSDLLFSHTTWDGYEANLRIFKHLNLALPRGDDARQPRRRRRVSFPASPAFLASVDDYYVTDAGLVVMETTNDNFNSDLQKFIRAEGTLMSWVRSMTANLLAETGQEWAGVLERYNSGTYNNQWMVVDLSRFRPHRPPREGLLWVAEQVPGLVWAQDMTAHLARASYWPSYNVPFFPFIFNISGFPAQVRVHGDDYDYHRCARAHIFRQRHQLVRSFRDMQALMRYNDYTRDPASLGDPALAISSRYDLRTAAQGAVNAGGIDCKVSSYHRALRLETAAVLGPTHDDVPVFCWDTPSAAPWSSHVGQPRCFNYSFVTMAP